MATMGFIKSTTETKSTSSSIIVPETFTHSIAFGQTGCGKTTSFIYLNLQNRLELGHAVLLYDYKGKEHLSVKFLANLSGRLDDVVEIGKPWGESINIIENMDEDEINRFFENTLKHGNDNQYWQNSAKSLGQSVLKILNTIDAFSKAMSLLDSEFIKSNAYIETCNFNYPKLRTLASLVEVCKTHESLIKFIDGLNDLKSEIHGIITKSAFELTQKGVDTELYKPIFKQLISSKKRLNETIKETRDSLESFGEDANKNLIAQVTGALVSPLLNLSQNSYFNTNSLDIISALNKGKIVVINTEALSGAAVESLNNILMYELSKRTKSTSIKPVSIFIDEVQRVISKNTDLPIDILREAKVDVFLATQNSALLKEKLQTEKYDALIGNLTRKYYFQNSSEEKLESSNELKLLKSFEYLSSEDDYLAVQSSTPLYITDTQKLQVEFIYQKKLNVLRDYLYENRLKFLVLEYVPRLYRDNKVIVINLKTKKEQILESFSKHEITFLNKEVDSLFKRIKEVNDDNFGIGAFFAS